MARGPVGLGLGDGLSLGCGARPVRYGIGFEKAKGFLRCLLSTLSEDLLSS